MKSTQSLFFLCIALTPAAAWSAEADLDVRVRIAAPRDRARVSFAEAPAQAEQGKTERSREAAPAFQRGVEGQTNTITYE